MLGPMFRTSDSLQQKSNYRKYTRGLRLESRIHSLEHMHGNDQARRLDALPCPT